jgi:hypothetical protein
MTLYFEPLWFDSMGAKSTSCYIKTPDVKIVIDPGAAIMHPSFPASAEQKTMWLSAAEKKIKNACQKANIITISHYHYDHFFPDDLEVYHGKTLYVKNPNEYINNKQRERAIDFSTGLCEEFTIDVVDKIVSKQKNTTFPDPLNDLPHASSKDFHSYNKRRKEVLMKGRKRFEKYAKKWSSYEQLPEIKSDEVNITFPEGETFVFGKTKLRFTKPLFHGIEYAGVGWVIATIIEYDDKKILHSSDVSGPMIEDYADFIIKENPSILFLDGPTTYLFGYILNRINLDRTINNMVRIIKEIDADVIIYDHHLTREKKFREHTKEVWETAIQTDKKVVTAAEYLGKKTVVEQSE